MNKHIEELAMDSGIFDCIIDPYDKLKNGGPYSSVMPDLERFVQLIIKECLSYMEDGDIDFAKFMIKEHFGVE